MSQFKKRPEVNGAGRPLTNQDSHKSSHLKCVQCAKLLSGYKQGKQCGIATYCGQTCQKQHWKIHRNTCKTISAIEANNASIGSSKQNVDTLKGSVNEITPKTRTKLAKVLGQKCTVNILMNGTEENVLWDTGAQVSLVSRDWVHGHDLGGMVKPIGDLFNGGLVIKSVSGNEIEYEGFLEVEVKPRLEFLSLLQEWRWIGRF